MFVDHIVISGESREQVEDRLERWRCDLERRGMEVRQNMWMRGETTGSRGEGGGDF